ncbi:MAG: phenylacetic acid degradation protein [Rhodothalassiaceae bacterium]|nr:MAG: phenylacetic acid degradation protein [Rhodothalassiaceae bacterium]
MRKYHPLTVASLEKAAEDAVLIRFAVPEELKAIFRHKPGQHLGIRAVVDGEELRRTYSICTLPEEGDPAVVVREVPGGRFSTFANRKLKAGDVLEVMPPVGHFVVEPDPAARRHHVAFVAGSGITPVMAILKAVLRHEPQSRFTLFYGNRTRETMIFHKELFDLKNRYMDRFALHPFFSREEQEIAFMNGRLDAEKVRTITARLLPVEEMDAVYVCGPGDMIDTVGAVLKDQGLPAERLHSERFLTSEEALRIAAAAREREKDRAAKATITVRLDGVTREVAFEPGQGTILEVLEAAGIEAPFSCRGGVCTTCRAKVLEGSAEMAINYGLEEAEVKKGYILTCQAVPTSEKLAISFDE